MNAVALLTFAALALVVQNLVMVKITSQSSSPLIAMASNAIVGNIILVVLLTWRIGPSALPQLGTSLSGWGLIPGVLGTFFVFSSIYGYQSLGPTLAATTLVAGQVIFGLLADSITGKSDILNVKTLLGLGLLILGAALVLSRHNE